EDGIRDRNVTGVQTCALPISFQYFRQFRKHWVSGKLEFLAFVIYAQEISAPSCNSQRNCSELFGIAVFFHIGFNGFAVADAYLRSEERRVGKECRSG